MFNSGGFNRQPFNTRVGSSGTSVSRPHIASKLALKKFVLPIDYDNTTFLAHYDIDASDINGIAPNSGGVYTLRPDGKYGGCVAVEEGTTNLWDALSTTGQNGPWTITNNFMLATSPFKNNTNGVLIQCTPRSYMNYRTISNTDGVAYPIGTVFTMSAWVYVEPNCDCMSSIRICGEGKTNVTVSYDKTKLGTWQYLKVTVTNTDVGFYFLLYANTGTGSNTWTKGNVYYANVQVEVRPFATSFVSVSKADGKLAYDINVDFANSDYTLFSHKRHGLEASFTNYALTKQGSTFTMYKNGVPTTEFKNKWASYSVKGVGQANKTWTITSYTKPSTKFYSNEFIHKTTFYNYSLSTNSCGFFFRTFVYATASVTVWHRYSADNAGGIRVNNGTPASIGGWMNPAVNSTNPDVRIDLIPGWNLVEVWYMDYDVGGGLSLQRNSGGLNSTGVDTGPTFADSIPLSSVPEVIYMTAELPVEFSSNKIYFNEKSNCLIDEVRIDQVARSEEEILAWYISSSPFYPRGNQRLILG